MPGYPLASAERKPQQFVNAIRSLQAGQVNYTGDVTLIAGATSTVVSTQVAGPSLSLVPTHASGAPNVQTTQGQHVFLFPQTAAAATIMAGGTVYAPRVVTPGKFTIYHAVAPAGCTFSWIVLG